MSRELLSGSSVSGIPFEESNLPDCAHRHLKQLSGVPGMTGIMVLVCHSDHEAKNLLANCEGKQSWPLLGGMQVADYIFIHMPTSHSHYRICDIARGDSIALPNT